MKASDWFKSLSSSENNINEEINKNTLDTSGVDYIITKTLAMVAQVHVWHLLARSGQKHTALGEFYTALDTEVDGLAEKFIAIGGKLINSNFDLITEYSDLNILISIKDYREEISQIISNVVGDSNLQSILDGLTDLQEEIDKFIYKFSF